MFRVDTKSMFYTFLFLSFVLLGKFVIFASRSIRHTFYLAMRELQIEVQYNYKK